MVPWCVVRSCLMYGGKSSFTGHTRPVSRAEVSKGESKDESKEESKKESKEESTYRACCG